MCNAWNHPPGCTCGWGGDGHLGRNTHLEIHSSYYPMGIPPVTGNYHSFVNPNALCPVCREQVFFYQSTFGGRVFFDELGPPWPKHPCTDSSSVPKAIELYEADPSRSYLWKVTGWSPILVTGQSIHGKGVMRIFTYTEADERGLYVAAAEWGNRIIPTDGLVGHIRQLGQNVFRLSLLSENGLLLELNAGAFASELAAQATTVKKPQSEKLLKKVSSSGNRLSVKLKKQPKIETSRVPRVSDRISSNPHKKDSKSTRSVQIKVTLEEKSRDIAPPHKRPPRPPKNTALADALRAAGMNSEVSKKK